MAPADTIIKSVSERPNGMFPPGKHVRARRTSVTHSSEQKNLILGKSEIISENPKIFRIFREVFGFSEKFSENPKNSRKIRNIFGFSEKVSKHFRFSEKK